MAADAGPGEVLVSQTVNDIVASPPPMRYPERGCQASLVIILQAPRAVQATSQAAMTKAATTVDSGTRSKPDASWR